MASKRTDWKTSKRQLGSVLGRKETQSGPCQSPERSRKTNDSWPFEPEIHRLELPFRWSRLGTHTRTSCTNATRENPGVSIYCDRHRLARRASNAMECNCISASQRWHARICLSRRLGSWRRFHCVGCLGTVRSLTRQWVGLTEFELGVARTAFKEWHSNFCRGTSLLPPVTEPLVPPGSAALIRLPGPSHGSAPQRHKRDRHKQRRFASTSRKRTTINLRVRADGVSCEHLSPSLRVGSVPAPTITSPRALNSACGAVELARD